MAKLKDMSKLVKEELEAIVKQLESPAFVREIGDKVAADIKKRTKLGYGVDSYGAAQTKLKPLSNDYKKARKNTQLSTDTSPAKSNLTKTGAMLNDIIVKVEGNRAVIDLGSQESLDKEQWNRESGRTFFNISKTQITQVASIIKSKIKEIIGN